LDQSGCRRHQKSWKNVQPAAAGKVKGGGNLWGHLPAASP